MDDAFKSAGWIIIVAVVAAYSTYMLAGSAFGQSQVTKDTIIIRDKIRGNEHHLTGTLYLTSSCDQLKVASKEVSTNTYEIAFETWPDAAVECKQATISRQFDLIVFAPSTGTRFIATLDNNPLSIAVYPTLSR